MTAPIVQEALSGSAIAAPQTAHHRSYENHRPATGRGCARASLSAWAGILGSPTPLVWTCPAGDEGYGPAQTVYDLPARDPYSQAPFSRGRHGFVSPSDGAQVRDELDNPPPPCDLL
ncbi:hypothetical protein PZA11_001198 [Diplocarpon coronariae]